MRHTAIRLLVTAALAALTQAGWAQGAVDADAAQALLKKSDCGKCHAVDKKKDGPAYKETAAKFKGKANAEQELVKHLTSTPKIKVDGKEEEHKAVKSKDAAEVANLARWILSR
jgi:cytochrome c